jgi:hypothetical protein
MTINLSKTTGRPHSTSPALISLIVRVSIHRFHPSYQSHHRKVVAIECVPEIEETRESCASISLLRPTRSLAFYFHLGIEKLHYSSLNIIISWVKERKQPHRSPCCLRWCRRSNSRSRWIFVSNQIFSPPSTFCLPFSRPKAALHKRFIFIFIKPQCHDLGVKQKLIQELPIMVHTLENRRRPLKFHIPSH